MFSRIMRENYLIWGGVGLEALSEKHNVVCCILILSPPCQDLSKL